MTTSRLLALVAVLSFSVFVYGKDQPKLNQPIRVSGCTLLSHPERYNGKLVETQGTISVGFERSDLTFPCSGRIGISLSLYESDLKKYGFLTEPDSKEALGRTLGETYPGEILNERKTKRVEGAVVGLFRCHYDFPTCQSISRNGDSSIVVKAVRLEQPTK